MSDVDAILFAFFWLALTISNLYLNICFQAKVNAKVQYLFLIISCILSSPREFLMKSSISSRSGVASISASIIPIACVVL
jgi:hypothetical protein